MDMAAFHALAERCAPEGANLKPLASIVREASDFAPLSLRFDGGPSGTMKLLASSKAEAIQLTSELVIAGHRVRVGLAGIDTRDLDRLGVSLADGFEPCANVGAAARLTAEDPSRLKAEPVQTGRPRLARAPSSERPAGPARTPGPVEPPAQHSWDVYGHGRQDGTLVYRPRE